MEAGEEISGGLFVTGGDAPEVFDDIEEAFDEIAFAVECEVAVAFDAAIRFGRDHHLDGARRQAADETVGVISLVGEQGLRRDFGGQRFGLGDVVGLPTRETDRQGISQGIDDGMNFRGQAAARPAYGLLTPPFLSAPALCW